jgi:UDP-GlcNAc:undecaprenyl-phosphate GlcNAc-1-phosphate transferase
MNSINMLDNMDAISSIVSVSVILTAIANILFINNYTNPDLFLLIGVLAALLGFLWFNWHPSVIYMGDTGSQFLGAFLGAIGIIYFWNRHDTGGVAIWSKQVITSALVFAIPIIDTTTVVIKRLRDGKSPFVGGKDHTTHHISYLGFTDKQVALIFIAISAVSIILSFIAFNFIHHWSYLWIFLYGLYFFILFIVLFTIANKNTHKH